MTVVYSSTVEQPETSGDPVSVSVWWKQSWGCPALHYEEQMPPVIGCVYDWDAAFPEDSE